MCFGERFDVNHAMICMKGGFVVQRHNELRDLEAELLNLVCKDVERSCASGYYGGSIG